VNDRQKAKPDLTTIEYCESLADAFTLASLHRHVGATRYKAFVEKRRRRPKDLTYTWRPSRGRPTKSEVAYAWRLRKLVYAGKEKPCADCGNFYAQGFGDRLTYDHLPGVKKSFDIGSVGVSLDGEIGHRLVPTKVLREEILKCEVVCLECHRKRETARNVEWDRLIRGAPHVAKVFDLLAAGVQATEYGACVIGEAWNVILEADAQAEPSLGEVLQAWDKFGRHSARAYTKAIGPKKLTGAEKKAKRAEKDAVANLERFESSVRYGCLQQALVLERPLEILAAVTRYYVEGITVFGGGGW
jgi:hypothetical protein